MTSSLRDKDRKLVLGIFGEHMMSRAGPIFSLRSPMQTGSVLAATIALGLQMSVQQARAADDVDALREQFQILQDENSGLKQKLDSQSEAIKTLMERLEALEQKVPETALTEEAVQAKETALAEELLDFEVEQEAEMAYPSQSLIWFGDFNFRGGGTVRNGEELPDTFTLGQLGLMASSQLSERVSVMSEVVFKYKADESASATIERLQLQYHANDLFNFRVGRTHTPFGYWNETFHHGTWFQTTALRPEIYRFHDGGSVMPIHSVGGEMYGYQPTKLMDVHYNFGVANGRGLTSTSTVNIQDNNDNKALYGVISLGPASVPGLRFGLNAYGDVIPPDPAVVGRNGDIDELIGGAHLVYLEDSLEFLFEGQYIDHDDQVSSQRFTTWGLYAQVGYRLKRFKPYYRYDILDVGEGDPYYGPLIVDVTRHTAGLRWDFITWAALKLEYQYIDEAQLAGRSAYWAQAAFTY